MAQMNLPAEPTYRRTSYSGLLGADFSVDPSLVDKRHSPDLLNMISDNGGNPVKRKGWEIVNNTYTGNVTNLWTFYAGGVRYIVFTEGEDNDCKLHIIDEEGTVQNIKQNGNDVTEIPVTAGKHCAFYTEISSEQSGFYIMDGTNYHRIYVSNNELTYQAVEPYVPTIIIARSPNAGGGEVYESINLLTQKCKEQFINSIANNKAFILTGTPVAGTVTAEYVNANGEWTNAPVASVSGKTVTLTNYYAPVVPYEDNIRITYTRTGTNNAGKILGSTINARFSETGSDQLFVSGGGGKNTVYYSAPNNIAYFPDLNYVNIGGETTIMGFLNLGSYLAIVKEGTSHDSTIFLAYQTSISTSSQSTTTAISSTMSTTVGTTDQVQTFAVKRATSGIGACSKYAFGVLNDEPLFLSQYGIHGVVSTSITSEKVVRNRSFYVDAKLTKEADLENAVACIWNNYYVLVVNGHAYVLDGRHKSSNYQGNTSYQYEAYYWENVPAISITSYDKELWFGTSDGRVCRFKNSGQLTDYADGTDKHDTSIAGDAIRAVWSTPNDNDGRTEYYKTMTKKGTVCTVAPYQQSSVQVFISVDGNAWQYIGMAYVDISTFFDGEIDFNRLSFDTRTGPRDFFPKRKIKKYQRIQIILVNDTINEPFGVFEIVKTYVVTKFAKGSANIARSITPNEPAIATRHTITVELEDEDKSMDFNGTRWR